MEENALTLFGEVTRGLRNLGSDDIISTFYLLLLVRSHFVGGTVDSGRICGGDTARMCKIGPRAEV
jgi:hypothetical protein